MKEMSNATRVKLFLLRKTYPILRRIKRLQKQQLEASLDDSKVIARGGLTIKSNHPEFFAGKSREEIAAYIREQCDVPEDVLRDFIAADNQATDDLHNPKDNLNDNVDNPQNNPQNDPQKGSVHKRDESR